MLHCFLRSKLVRFRQWYTAFSRLTYGAANLVAGPVPSYVFDPIEYDQYPPHSTRAHLHACLRSGDKITAKHKTQSIP